MSDEEMRNKIKLLFADKKCSAINKTLRLNKDCDDYVFNILKKEPAYGLPSGVIWCILNDIVLPKCVLCGKSIGYKAYRENKRTFCSFSCSRSKEGTKLTDKKIKKTCLERYGVEYATSTDIVKKKRLESYRKNFGTDHPSQNEEWKINHNFCYRKKNQEEKDKIKITSDIRTYERLKKRLVAWDVIPMFSKFEGYTRDNKRYFDFKCLVCETEFITHLDNRKPLCPKCFGQRRSNQENEVYNYLNSLNSLKILKGRRNIIKPLELDIYIPEKKVAIEFDGLYWHSDLFKDVNYHLDKTTLCNENGVQLIHIFEDEWIIKDKIVKSRLKHILGLTKNSIYARKCCIKLISAKQSSTFLNKYHIQGNVDGSVKLGLFYKNRLVAVMTFGKSRFNKNYDWELLRYCTISSFNIVGGASRLLKCFRSNYSGSIISYADKRWSNGNLYKQLGFNELKDSSKNYFYVKNGMRYSRNMFQKHKLKDKLEIFDESLSERDNMINNGYYRIYDCGNKVFVLL